MIYARVRLGKYLSERYEVACGGRLVAGGGIFSGQEFVGMRRVLPGLIERVGWRRCCDSSVVLRASCIRTSPAFSEQIFLYTASPGVPR